MSEPLSVANGFLDLGLLFHGARRQPFTICLLSSCQSLPSHMNTVTRRSPESKALHAIACFEALKGIAAIAASIGLLSLAHHDVRAMAYALIGHFHLDPDAHYPKMLLDDVSMLANSNLRQAVLLAWGYAAIRLLEGYGLWKDRAWAEWLAALSGTVYLPWELDHQMRHTTAINALVLFGNVSVVAFMVARLRRRKNESKASLI